MKKPLDQARLFLDKAAQDESLLELAISSPQISDGIFGFHAQQAAEKILKALLSAKQIRFGKTHNLDELIELACGAGFSFPAELAEVELLNPFAVEYRYDEIPDSEPPLDRKGTQSLLKRLRIWVEQNLSV